MAENEISQKNKPQDIPAGATVILFDNQRGRLVEKMNYGYLVHIILDNGTNIYTDPSEIEAYINETGWVYVNPQPSNPYSM